MKPNGYISHLHLKPFKKAPGTINSSCVKGTHRQDDGFSEISAARRSNLNQSFTRDVDRTTATSLGRDPFNTDSFKKRILEKASVKTPFSNIGQNQLMLGNPPSVCRGENHFDKQLTRFFTADPNFRLLYFELEKVPQHETQIPLFPPFSHYKEDIKKFLLSSSINVPYGC